MTLLPDLERQLVELARQHSPTAAAPGRRRLPGAGTLAMALAAAAALVVTGLAVVLLSHTRGHVSGDQRPAVSNPTAPLITPAPESTVITSILALQDSRYCFSSAEFNQAAQALLDRLGWRGWHVLAVRLAPDRVGVPGTGSCAQVALDRSGVRAHVVVKRRLLMTHTGPPPSISKLVERLAPQVFRDSAAQCYVATVALKEIVRNDLAPHHLRAAFLTTLLPSTAGIGFGLHQRYDHQCAIAFELHPAATDPRLIDVWLASKQGGFPPFSGVIETPPQSSYR